MHYCLFLAVLGLCCTGSSQVVASGLLAAGASVVGEHRVSGAQASVTAAPELRAPGSAAHRLIALAPGLSCSAACGILPDQGSNPWLLHWQADSPPLSPQGRLVMGCLG